jgi:hypothetical protein
MGSKVRPARTAHKLGAIYEPILTTLLDPQHLTTLYDSTACYGNSFTFLCINVVHTLQETHLRVTTGCYGDDFIIYI